MGKIPPPVIRLPPPPLHLRSLMAGNKEDGNTKVVRGNSTRTYYSRRCKRKRLTNIESLPDDLLLEILVLLPAQDIYDPARLVCRKWYHMIHTRNFINAHLQHTTYHRLLFHTYFFNSFFVAVRQGRIEISKFNYKFRYQVRGSCNGLFLEIEPVEFLNLCIANPATKQKFILPPFHWAILSTRLYGMACSAASMEYKVVVADYNNARRQKCFILTGGVDNSWRYVDIEHLSLTATKVLDSAPLITEGFMHWAKGGIEVVTLNIETEIITETPAPIPQVYGGQNRKYYLSMGRYLSLLIACKQFLWEVWEMKPETGEWRKLRSIGLEAQKHTFERFGLKHDEYLMPVGWLKYLEVLAFGASRGRTFIFFNLLTQEIDLFQPPPIDSIRLPPLCGIYKVMVHKNSLCWLDGC